MAMLGVSDVQLQNDTATCTVDLHDQTIMQGMRITAVRDVSGRWSGASLTIDALAITGDSAASVTGQQQARLRVSGDRLDLLQTATAMEVGPAPVSAASPTGPIRAKTHRVRRIVIGVVVTAVVVGGAIGLYIRQSNQPPSRASVADHIQRLYDQMDPHFEELNPRFSRCLTELNDIGCGTHLMREYGAVLGRFGAQFRPIQAPAGFQAEFTHFDQLLTIVTDDMHRLAAATNSGQFNELFRKLDYSLEVQSFNDHKTQLLNDVRGPYTGEH